MKYPHYTIYENLYKRYFLKGVDYLINKAQISKDDIVLDICGGNARLTKEVLKTCKNVSYLDKEKQMIPAELQDLGVTIYNQKIEDFVKSTNKKFTKVFCEQAINYWLLNIDIKKFSDIFTPGGVFVFNTFLHQPTTKPMIKEYNLDGLNYLEISYLIKNKVQHIQICEGHKPHTTVFDWISKEMFIKLLSPYFEIEIHDSLKSSLYICKRK